MLFANLILDWHDICYINNKIYEQGFAELKIAITEWNDRIAPVFDVTGQAIILEVNDGGIVREEKIALPEGCPREKVLVLREQDVRQLICGAISCHARMEAEIAGIKVYDFIAGDYREVIEAWRKRLLSRDRYAMPGCGRQKRCRRRQRNHFPNDMEQEK